MFHLVPPVHSESKTLFPVVNDGGVAFTVQVGERYKSRSTGRVFRVVSCSVGDQMIEVERCGPCIHDRRLTLWFSPTTFRDMDRMLR